LALLITSTAQNKTVPYHDKIIRRYSSILSNIHEKLYEANPVLSGSSAVNIIYTPGVPSNDIDLYFLSQEDFDSAKNILDSIPQNTYFETENAISYNSQRVQLIKSIASTEEEIIYSHDFINVSCAISNNGIFSSKETHYSWYNQELALRNFQVQPDSSPQKKLTVLHTLLTRTNKYLDRYQLTLADSYKQFLHNTLDWLSEDSVIDLFLTNQNEPVYDYYGNIIDFTISSKDCARVIKSLLIPQYSIWGTDLT